MSMNELMRLTLASIQIHTSAEYALRLEQEMRESTKPGWDNIDNSPPLLIATWQRAFELIEFVVSTRYVTQRPLVNPCGDGSVHLDWLESTRRVRIEVWPKWYYCVEEDRDRNPIREEQAPEANIVKYFLRTVFQRQASLYYLRK